MPALLISANRITYVFYCECGQEVQNGRIMLPLFHEYQIGHHRFKEHLRNAFLMAMIAPVCAVVYFQVLGWWNPWLWGTCGAGMSIALCLFSVVKLHRKPSGISRVGEKMVETSPSWFPFFFVIVQSSIASVIVMFLWFSFTALALDVPVYVDAILVILALLIPWRRYVSANISHDSQPKYERWSEILRGAWHVLMTVFIVRTILGLTLSDTRDASPENVVWQVILWLPASLYIVFTIVITIQHLQHGHVHRKPPAPGEQAPSSNLERF